MMEWKRLLSPKRVGNYAKSSNVRSGDLRSEFEKDYHRIIGSSSFRRLQDKTQVFALDKSDFIRTRLTHSLEVSSFAKSMGQNIAQYLIENHVDDTFTQETKADICDILQCAGLIHDIGNPPFGHFGEEAIRDWFVRRLHTLSFQGKPVTEVLTNQMVQDFYHFEGNAQALRQVTKLHFLVNENGMNLTYALLNTIIKYPVSSENINPESGKIAEYLKELKTQYQEVAAGVYCDDWNVDALLCQKADYCRRNGIENDFLFQGYVRGETDDGEFVMLLRELLDTACYRSRETGSASPVIRLHATVLKNQTVVKFSCEGISGEGIAPRNFRRWTKKGQGSVDITKSSGGYEILLTLQRK